MATPSNNDTTRFALALGDDALTMGQRLSEWISNGPFLEEDLALTNVTLDYIGRARMFLSYAGETEGQGRGEDDLAFSRDCRDFSNLLRALPARRRFVASSPMTTTSVPC